MKITISGIGGVGKGTTAKILAEHLGYKTKSGGDFFRKMAKDLNMTLYKFDQFVKDNPEYDYKLDEMQKKFGKKNNNFVLESRLGWFFVPDSFKIKLNCEERERVKRIAERDNLSFNFVKKEEEKRLDSINSRYEKLYNLKDWQSKKNFDLIIDTTNINPKEVVLIILNELKK